MTLRTTLEVVMSVAALFISILAAEDHSNHTVTSAVVAEILVSADFITNSTASPIDSPIIEVSISETPAGDGSAPIPLMSEPTSPVANVSYSNIPPDARLNSHNLCVHWQIYKWVDASPNPVRIGKYYEECDSAPSEDAEAVPYSLINQQNKLLRDQLSFIVGCLEWEDYLQLSSEYSQLH